VLWVPARLAVILSEAKNLFVVLRMAMTVPERFFAWLRMTPT
jgi:predicted RNase H-like HicB family nuclease